MVLKGAIVTLEHAREFCQLKTVVTKEWNNDCPCGGCIPPGSTVKEKDHSRDASKASILITQKIVQLRRELRCARELLGG
jgi:hypothetical protein